jgi:hypothetical protein
MKIGQTGGKVTKNVLKCAGSPDVHCHHRTNKIIVFARQPNSGPQDLHPSSSLKNLIKENGAGLSLYISNDNRTSRLVPRTASSSMERQEKRKFVIWGMGPE